MLDRSLTGRLATLLLLFSFHAGAAELQDFENLPVKANTGTQHSADDVRAAIVEAGLGLKWESQGRRQRGGSLRWSFEEDGPGKLRGLLVVHERHFVEVDIPYAADQFSVLYRTSRNMDYAEVDSKRQIHPNYNVWVRNLVHAASLQITRIGAKGTEASASVEISFWESVRNSTNPAELQAYLDQFPNGRFAVLARARMTKLGVAPKVAPPAAVVAAPLAPAPEVASAPRRSDDRLPAAGDTWTYRFLPQGRTRGAIRKYTVTVRSASEGSVRDRSALEGAEASEWEHSKSRDIAMLGTISLFSPYLLAFEAPEPGARIADIEVRDPRVCNSGSWTCSVSGRVLGPEVVTVLAGTFKTVKVRIEQNWSYSFSAGFRPENGGRVLTAWYAPEVKRAVKYASSGLPSQYIDTQFELELVSYKLN